MRASILVVDDEPGIRDLLAWELTRQGHEVTSAADGGEAVDLVRRSEFDLLVSDIRMPRVGGLEVLRRTKQVSPDTEVVITTGFAELDYAVECVRQGAFDFIQKPFQMVDLLGTVSRALDRRRLRQAARLHQASLARRAAASERLASVGLLAAGVAHEISNPAACVLANQACLEEHVAALGKLADLLEVGADVAAVRGAWEALGGRAFLRELEESLGDLGAGASRIHDIARDMKSLARNDPQEPVEFDLNETIRSALRITSAELRHRAAVRTELTPNLPILGNPGRISQVFVNLLVNAAQALGELRDECPHEIVIRSERRGDCAVATVSDDGPGIRPEHLSRIFETFFTTKGTTVGTGLGLPISREIVRNHGGDLCVESAPGHGATFIVTVPYAGNGSRRSSPPLH